MFTDSVAHVLGEVKEINLVGFGNFSIFTVEARTGRNPKTGEVIQIPRYKQPRFKVSKKLKDAVN